VPLSVLELVVQRWLAAKADDRQEAAGTAAH
jgi:hypothetical protein